MQTTAADPLLGRTLEGRYRILDRIARGGMSVVYAAVDERLDRLVAVKVMSAALSDDPAFTDRFSREARAAARLSHLNTVAVYDQGTDSGPAGHHVFLVMELVEGRTLRELIRERGRLSPAEAISIMEPVLGALAAAHRAGLVHRDVKPENILLSDEGVVKVADFGLARAVESDASATRTGLMMGTVAYCAPEQISKGHADQRSDVYSAGIVLFELLTGAPPYRGESAMNVAYQHVHHRVPAPSSRVKGIPSEIDELVVNATDSDPLGRPVDAAMFLAEVAEARAELGLPVVAVPSRVRPRSRLDHATGRDGQPAAHAPIGATTDVLRGGGLHDTVVTGVRGARNAEEPPPPPIVTPPPKQRRQVPPKTRRRRRGLLVVLLVLLLGAAAGYGGWWLAAGRYSLVPNVAGDSLSVARADLQQAHYQPGAVTTQFSETVASGAVIGTDPGVGSRLVRGRTVTIVLSRGAERFTVPQVAGGTVAQAQAALAAIPVQLASPPTQEPSDTVKAGLVLRTNPPAGTRVRRNQVITLIVSSGPPIITIPVIGPNTTFDSAKAALTRAGFAVTRQDQFSTTVAKGIVISSSPTGSAVKFTVITVVVSKGPEMVAVPDIGAQTPVADAEAALTKVGLSYQVKSIAGSGGTIVLAISPSSGTRVQVGSTVIIYAF